MIKMGSIRPSQEEQTIIDSLVSGRAIRWIAPWAGYVIALLVGSVLEGKGAVDTGLFVIGLPIAWLAGWVLEKKQNIGVALIGLMLVSGLLVGYFA